MIKIGLIGCGHWGPNYVRAFGRIKGVSLDCACDLDKKKLKIIKGKHPHLKITANIKDILDSKSLDAVVIATPAKSHFSLVKAALKKGKHVLVEKPLTVNAKEAQSLIKFSRECKKVLFVGHIFEYNDGIIAIKNYFSKKALGKVHYMYSRRTNLGPIREDVNAIWDLALHDISIFNFVLNAAPLKVTACGFSYLRSNIEDVGFLTLYYSRNVIAHIHVSWLDPRKIREIVAVGSEKMLMFNDLDYNQPIKIYDKRVMKKKYEKTYDTFKEFKMIIKDGQTNSPKIKIKEPLLQECKSFIKCLKAGVANFQSLKKGVEAVAVLEAAKKSLTKNGKMIKIAI